MVSTLRGVGEYMTEYNAFWTSQFQIWDVKLKAEIKIGSGGIGAMRLQATDAVSTGLPVQTVTPACNGGQQHCVA